eukprot:Gb_28537 [translate_table: standard]
MLSKGETSLRYIVEMIPWPKRHSKCKKDLKDTQGLKGNLEPYTLIEARVDKPAHNATTSSSNLLYGTYVMLNKCMLSKTKVTYSSTHGTGSIAANFILIVIKPLYVLAGPNYLSPLYLPINCWKAWLLKFYQLCHGDNQVWNAFGPSFGTVCFSGLVCAVVQIIRAAMEKARAEDKDGTIYIMLRCCVDFVSSAIEFINKFTINFAAITGESYCSSAKMTYELLKRNLLSAVVVETISTRLLFGIFFVVSVIYAIAVWAVLKAATSLGRDAYFVTGLAWLLLFMILIFFVHVLDNVIDTVYIFYATDRDTGSVSKSAVHDVYVLLPISRNHHSSLAIQRP